MLIAILFSDNRRNQFRFYLWSSPALLLDTLLPCQLKTNAHLQCFLCYKWLQIHSELCPCIYPPPLPFSTPISPSPSTSQMYKVREHSTALAGKNLRKQQVDDIVLGKQIFNVKIWKLWLRREGSILARRERLAGQLSLSCWNILLLSA